MTCSKKIRPVTGLSSIWVRENSACRIGDVIPVAGVPVGGVNGCGSRASHLRGSASICCRSQRVADRLQRGRVLDGGEAVVQRR